MDTDKSKLRDTRDTLINQLSLASAFPITNLQVLPERETVAYNSATSIIIGYSQPTVRYDLYDSQNSAVIQAQGTGDTLKIPTGVLTKEDYTFSIMATNTTSGFSKQLLQTVTVKVGVDTNLSVSFINPIIDFNTAAVVLVEDTQSNSRYEVFDPKDASLGQSVDSGPDGGDIQLTTVAIKEDVVIKVRATNIKTNLNGTLLMQPEIKVAPDVTLAVSLKEPVAYNGQATVIVNSPQKTAAYQLRLEDIDDDDADKTQLKGKAISESVSGTGKKIQLITEALQEDVTVSILATKNASGVSKTLQALVIIPVKPDPTKVLSLVKDGTDAGKDIVINSLAPGESAAIKVANTQKGVMYQLRSGDINIGPPVYHHKNYGIGRARINIELAIGEFSSDSVYLPTGVLTQTTTFSVLAIKATTRLEATLINTITVQVK